MKQYFTGFFTAVCLTASVFLFMGSQNKNLGAIEVESIVLKGENGKTIIMPGILAIYNNDDTKDNISQSSSTASSDEIQKDDDKYLSYSEKKILNGIQNNEKLLKEILEKLNDITNKGEQ